MPQTIDPLDVADLLITTMERDVIARLMSGNDAQCFTTEQYETVRDQWIADAFRGGDASGLPKVPLEYARSQLRKCRRVVEVKPDVWTLAELSPPAGVAAVV